MTGTNENSTRPSIEETLEAVDICQESNVFTFYNKLYRQKKGLATGKKPAPPVACAGAGVAEEKWLAIPGMRELFDEYSRYIDDMLSLFNGDKDMYE